MNANRVRVIAVVVIVIAFAALATFALLARAYRPGRGGVEVPSATARLTTQVALPTAAAVAAAEVLAAQVDAPAVAAVVPAPSAAPTPPPSSAPNPPPSTNNLPPCPAGLAVPTEPAGLANMVGLVPLFGPFSPEAFAMMPAFGPAFPLFGPLLIAGGEQMDAHAAEIDAAVQVIRPLEQAGFDALNPLYAPYRDQFLAAEAALAETLEPGVAAFANAPGASCFPAALALLFP